jgi:hypothetical protein
MEKTFHTSSSTIIAIITIDNDHQNIVIVIITIIIFQEISTHGAKGLDTDMDDIHTGVMDKNATAMAANILSHKYPTIVKCVCVCGRERERDPDRWMKSRWDDLVNECPLVDGN